MTETDARRLARIGEFYIQEAILTLLEDANEGLLLDRIRRKLALPVQGFNATVTGQLRRLKREGKVHQPRGQGREWALTAAERERRQGKLGAG